MTKSYLSILLICLLTTRNLLPDSGHLRIKPMGGLFIPTSPELGQYYDRKKILIYGGEIEFNFPLKQLGIYMSAQQYRFSIHDKNLIGGFIWEKGNIFHFGIKKELKYKQYSLCIKTGISKHNDELAFIASDDSRIGFHVGTEIRRTITRRIAWSGSIIYDYEKLNVPEYVTFVYSRHCFHLSGEKFNTGGFIIQSGLLLTVF